jgi:hypothetical protein
MPTAHPHTDPANPPDQIDEAALSEAGTEPRDTDDALSAASTADGHSDAEL